jgi:hypothetical protein
MHYQKVAAAGQLVEEIHRAYLTQSAAFNDAT